MIGPATPKKSRAMETVEKRNYMFFHRSHSPYYY
jgi:hypothetical protein